MADIQPPQRAGHVVVGSHYPHRKHVRRRRHRLPSTGDLAAAAAAAAAAPQRRLLPGSVRLGFSSPYALPSRGRRDERQRRRRLRRAGQRGQRGCGAAAASSSSDAAGERQRDGSPGAVVGSGGAAGAAATAAAAGNHTGSSVPGCSSCCHDDDVTDATTGGGEEGYECVWKCAREGADGRVAAGRGGWRRVGARAPAGTRLGDEDGVHPLAWSVRLRGERLAGSRAAQRAPGNR